MTRYEVTLEWTNGGTDTVAVDPKESVLEAAQRERIRLPADCRKGTCITCVGRVLAVDGDGTDGGLESPGSAGDDEGPVDAANAFDYRRQPAALTKSERADGYVLLCIAVPRADCRVAVGPMIRAEVGDSPWG
ncbi:2Fe-2S iron-sulfur cluster binding domain-containing protein [Natronorubrum sp. JWXQ-INN-674]|uniref:2Fe-2S iron-sulfur cluster binding domain-containing protein n=1 Tax=Natronorubrum halalkaliphilum TaxID=2691917 RepID=A0A6B0VMF0_9EURY|nr:2Fe-2S iron-sulfur cluster-binding protein [Natronorubrum halalkaliphilum]MXV62648.1 2Fe-2S iron-sulfur cluster binding domain-containing protein [Natronorubrum halalkaliphilum]